MERHHPVQQSDISKRSEKMHRGWTVEDRGNGCVVWSKVVDPKIQAKMPVSGRTFLQVGPLEIVRDRLAEFIRTGC